MAEDTAKYFFPTVVYIVVLMITGLLGNSLAVVVYSKRFKGSSTRTMTLGLSVAGLAANLVCFPQKLAELSLQQAFNFKVCPTFNFIHSSLNLFSVGLLTVVALDRQRRVCLPSKRQLTDKQARVAVCACAVVAVFLSAPFFALSKEEQRIPVDDDSRTTDNTNASIVFSCSMYCDDLKDHWQYLHFILIVVFIICSIVVITGSYILLARHIRKHQKATRTRMAAVWPERRSFPRPFCCMDMAPGTSSQVPAPTQQPGDVCTDCECHPGRPEVDEVNARTTASQEEPTASDVTAQVDEMCCDVIAPEVVVTTEVQSTTAATEMASEPLGDNSALAVTVGGVPDHTNRLWVDTVRWAAWQGGARCIQAVSSMLSPFVQRNSTVTAAMSEEPDMVPPHDGYDRRPRRDAILSRTTKMLFVVTVIFAFSYLPRLIIIGMHLSRGDGHGQGQGQGHDAHALSLTQLNVHFVFLYSNFISFTVNPIVYSVLSATFRRDCRRLLLDLRRKYEAKQRGAETCSSASCDL